MHYQISLSDTVYGEFQGESPEDALAAYLARIGCTTVAQAAAFFSETEDEFRARLKIEDIAELHSRTMDSLVKRYLAATDEDQKDNLFDALVEEVALHDENLLGLSEDEYEAAGGDGRAVDIVMQRLAAAARD
jgi:NAD(P)H-dependent FMN reductase